MCKSAFVLSRRFILALFTFLIGIALPVAAVAEARVSEAYGKLPLHFEANRGQTHEDIRFLARGPGYSLYLTAGEAVLVLARPNADAKRDSRSTPERLSTQARGTPLVVRMSLLGAAPKSLVSGLDELPGKANYFIGKDPAKWRTNVPTYAKVHYREVYPGIDLLYYGNQRRLEYDFVVAPGADPNRIVLGFEGAERLEIAAEGDLVLHVAGGVIRQRVPVIYQELDGVRTEIEGGYVLKGANRIGFEVAAYDRSQPLVIDPVLVYSTYLGGSGDDFGHGIAVDAAGAAYVTGVTTSTDFTAGCTAPCTVLDGSLGGSFDAFVVKIVDLTPPPSTPGCEVTIADNGKITAANGDKATFHGHAQVSMSGQQVDGQQRYEDHGPAQPLTMQSINVLSVVCSPDRTEATIFGEATVDGAGPFNYRIRVKDGGEPGKGVDMYGIVLSSGYVSGDQTLESGNVQIAVQE